MIKKDMLIGEIISKHPEIAEQLMSMGIFCVGCPGSHFETLEMGLKVHGKTDKEIDDFLKRLNKLIKDE
jgi:hybrid cluster-associated redox disulfide protein